MKPNVRIECPKCRTGFIVMPPEIYGAIQTVWGAGDEVGFTKQVATDVAMSGDRLAIGDVLGAYRCPECGTEGMIPPDVWGLSGDSEQEAGG